MTFRTLTPRDVEVRTQRVYMKDNVVRMVCLTYKNARVDRAILDETVGAFRWKNEYCLVNGNLFCTISIKDEQGEWISRQDVGTQSNMEKEKGEASDAFKRAAFAWGIGVELYNAPIIDIPLFRGEYCQKGNAYYPTIKLEVSQMDVDPITKDITTMELVNSDTKEIKFFWSRLPMMTQAQTDKAVARAMEGEDILPKLKGKFALTSDVIKTINKAKQNK